MHESQQHYYTIFYHVLEIHINQNTSERCAYKTQTTVEPEQSIDIHREEEEEARITVIYPIMRV